MENCAAEGEECSKDNSMFEGHGIFKELKDAVEQQWRTWEPKM